MTSWSYRLNTRELPPLRKTVSGKKGATFTSIEVKHDNYRSEVTSPLWQHPSSSIVAKAISYTNQRIVTLREPKLREYKRPYLIKLRTQHARISCSAAPKEVQVPVVKTLDPKSKAECYGVFCLTYDLRVVSVSSPL
ncbi:hypothetical protein ACSQ67_006056 [Phaseolus vulgaris]